MSTLQLFDELVYQQACWPRDTSRARKSQPCLAAREPRWKCANRPSAWRSAHFLEIDCRTPQPCCAILLLETDRNGSACRLQSLGPPGATNPIVCMSWIACGPLRRSVLSHGTMQAISVLRRFRRSWHPFITTASFSLTSSSCCPALCSLARIGATSAARRSRTTFANELPECIRCTSRRYAPWPSCNGSWSIV